MRLPVVSRPGDQEIVERLLPLCERTDRNVLAKGMTEAAELIHQLVAVRRVTCVAKGQGKHLSAVDLGRQKWERGGLAKDRPGAEFFGHRLAECPVAAKSRERFFEWECNCSAEQMRTKRVAAEFEFRDDPEISTSAAHLC